MPRKQRNSLADDLMEALHGAFVVVPWWIGPPVVLLAFAVFRWMVPAIIGPSKGLLQIDVLSYRLAPFFVGLVALCWVLALVVKRRRWRLLESQSGLDSIRAMGWEEFEHLTGEFFRRQGYLVEEKGGRQPDGGIDLVLIKGGRRTLVQCKHWKEWKVGVQPIREFFGVMAAEGGAPGKFVTTGRFTADAMAFAKGKPLELVDGEALWRMVSDMRAAKATGETIRAAIDATEAGPTDMSEGAGSGDFSGDLRSDVQSGDEPVCPRCSAKMIKREARRGANAGQAFWGCSQFPRCRGVRAVEG